MTVRKLKRLANFSRREKILILQAMVSLIVIDFRLRTQGLKRTQVWLFERSHHLPIKDEIEPKRLAVIINIAANRVPLQNMCLRKSLLLWWWLKKRNIESDIVIGIDKKPRQPQMHAWVEIGAQILNDAPDIRTRYVTIGTLWEEPEQLII